MNTQTPRRQQFLQWNQKRLQQYADRSGLSLQVVKVLLNCPIRARSFKIIAAEIDRTVDADLQLHNMPRI